MFPLLSGGAPQALGTGDSPTFAGLTISGLTITRIPFAGTGGLLDDSALLVFDEANARLTVGTGSAGSQGWVIGNNASGDSRIAPTSTGIGGANALVFTGGIFYAIAADALNLQVGGSVRMSFSSTAGAGPSITAGTATTDVNALSVTQTANNAAVVDFIKATWTVTTAAAAASYLRMLAGTAGTSPALVGRKTGDLEIGSTAITAAQGTSCLSVKHATTTLSGVTGASVTASNLIPAKANVLGVNTVVTTGLGTGSGTTGYTVGDGSDADRWGSVTGTAAGTDTDGNDATADPTGWFTAANNVVITAAGGNFDGTGAIFVHVMYTLSEAS